MQKVKMFLDDLRNPPDWSTWLTFRNAKSFVRAVKIHWDRLECISLDHDLGENELTGYDVICEIEKMAHERGGIGFDILVHSQNPVGRQNIERAIKAIPRKN